LLQNYPINLSPWQGFKAPPYTQIPAACSALEKRTQRPIDDALHTQPDTKLAALHKVADEKKRAANFAQPALLFNET